MIELTWFVQWADITPRGRLFDASAARSIAEELVAHAAATTVDREELEDAIDCALVSVHGAWAAGWNWAASEPGGGGPIRSWCCAHHSLLREDDTGPAESIERVVSSLVEWREFLLKLDREFEAIHDATSGEPLDRAAEHAAAWLLPTVLDVTDAEDAWYSTFARVFTWYLESRGIDSQRVGALVGKTISGHFSSWTAPDPGHATTACRALGHAVAEALADAPLSRDSLSEWLAIRRQAFENFPTNRERPRIRTDGHRRYIEGPERARDRLRSEHMANALNAARASAGRGEQLNFDALARFQRLVLGVPKVEFRKTVAYAKQGAERYPLEDDTFEKFRRCLDEASDSSTPVAVRAARVYLDVCYFHPFPDGNSRAARIALDYVLSSEGLALQSIEPIVIVSRAANDVHGAGRLAYIVEKLLGVH